MKLSYNSRRSPRRYADRSDYTYCSGVSGCTGCKEQCPNGVAVNEINRCLGYAEGYGDKTLAKENYHRLPRSNQLEQCHDCDECQVKCRNGLNLTERIKRASTIFLS